MTLSEMKEELHQRLWAMQDRWFAERAEGATKRGLKLRGLRERGDLFLHTRQLLFTGATRVCYERELKRFLDYVHGVRGRSDTRQVDRGDFRAYVEDRIAAGAAATELAKLKSAIVKFGVVYGKSESFQAMSRKLGKRIRMLKREGVLGPPARPHVTPQVREAVIRRLEDLDSACRPPRGYALALRLQKEASLRAIEATERFTSACLAGLAGGRGTVRVLGKGGRVRTAEVSEALYRALEAQFGVTGAGALAPLRAYQQALRRAILEAGGRSTGSHAQRRTSATEHKNRRYREHCASGLSPQEARERAVADTVEHLGHSRTRRDLASAYLG